jgi:hypothetical protein
VAFTFRTEGTPSIFAFAGGVVAIVEPVVTEEKLRECLGEQHEQSCLDYKRVIDFKTTKDTLEFAKDVAAFQAEPMGGYIVVGADGGGNLVDDLATVDLLQFDESALGLRSTSIFRVLLS